MQKNSQGKEQNDETKKVKEKQEKNDEKQAAAAVANCISETEKKGKQSSKKTSNLKPVQSSEEARERGKKGGEASARVRRIKSSFKAELECLLEEVKANGDSGYREVMQAFYDRRLKKGEIEGIEFALRLLGEQGAKVSGNLNIECILSGLSEVADNDDY